MQLWGKDIFFRFAVGYYHNFKQNTYEFSVEGYYKKLRNAVDFRDHAELLLNESFEGELRFGKGYAYGLEMMLAKKQGTFLVLQV